MTDGHTPEGSYEVTLTLTGDMVKQLARLVDLAKLMDGRDFKGSDQGDTLDVVAHRAFLEEILVILYQGIDEATLRLLVADAEGLSEEEADS